MYKKIVRPLFFIAQPEAIHHFVDGMLKTVFAIPGVAWFTRKLCWVKDPKLQKNVFGIDFPNPVGFAAGFDKQATLFNHLANFGFGFVEIGTVTPKPQPGNTKPRLFRLVKDEALINRMGFNNVGLDKFVNNLQKKKKRIIIGGNIGKNTNTPNEQAKDDYIACFEALHSHVDYFAVNVSCPNVKNLRELQDKDSTIDILDDLMKINKGKESLKPVLLKISPDLNEHQLNDVVEIVERTKIDGIIATNTTIERRNLETKKEIVEKKGSGGLSGKPLRERSTEVIRYLSKKTGGKIPIIGVGGIHNPSDAIEKLKAGASLIQIYTGFIYEGPFLAKKINKALLKYNSICKI